MTKEFFNSLLMRPDDSQAPDHYRGYMLMALTPTWLAFIEYRQGFVRPSLGKVLAAYDRDSVGGFGSSGGLIASSLTINFKDGTSFGLELSRNHKGEAIANQIAGG
jgi:hypothetical protein